MDRQGTQFWVAIIGMGGLVGVTLMAVAGSIFAELPNELPFMLAGGLLSTASTASAWLFRVNGRS